MPESPGGSPRGSTSHRLPPFPFFWKQTGHRWWELFSGVGIFVGSWDSESLLFSANQQVPDIPLVCYGSQEEVVGTLRRSLENSRTLPERLDHLPWGEALERATDLAREAGFSGKALALREILRYGEARGWEWDDRAGAKRFHR